MAVVSLRTGRGQGSEGVASGLLKILTTASLGTSRSQFDFTHRRPTCGHCISLYVHIKTSGVFILYFFIFGTKLQVTIMWIGGWGGGINYDHVTTCFLSCIFTIFFMLPYLRSHLRFFYFTGHMEKGD
jgi:hypothetical protein